MNIFDKAKALNTIGWFMGDMSRAHEILCEHLKKENISAFSYQMHDGSYWSVSFEVDRLLARKALDQVRGNQCIQNDLLGVSIPRHFWPGG